MGIKGSPLKYLGFLGFLGLLGLFTDNPGFYGFFGGFAFFGLANIKNDERLSINLAKAGFIAWIVTFVGLASAIALTGVTQSAQTALFGLSLVYPASILTFVGSFTYYDR